MRRYTLFISVAVLLAFCAVALAPAPAQALGLGDVLKIGGIGLAVSMFGKDINKTINKLLGEREAALRGATKVVPIITVGRGTLVGAAQVVGTPDRVKLVQAVAQLEERFASRFRLRVLIPISTKRPGRTVSGVGGTGVSAVIEFKI